MSITTAAVSKVTATDAHFLIEGAIHEIPLTSWRGSSAPKMGDTVEILFDDAGQVTRFFPAEANPEPQPSNAPPEQPKPTFQKPQYRREEVEVLGNPYVVWRRHGIVVSANAQTHTSISTGYRTLATGQVVANVQSAEYTTSEIRLQREDGSITDFEFGEKFKVRDGDEISICYIAERTSDDDAQLNGWPLGIQNYTTRHWQASTYIWNVGERHHKLRFHRQMAEMNSFKGFMIHAGVCGTLGAMAVGSLTGAFWGFAGLLTLVVHHWILAIGAATSGQREIRATTERLLGDF